MFLNEGEQGGTRVDMLFNLLANEYKKKSQVASNQNYFPFLVFAVALTNANKEDKEDFVKSLWSEVEKLYAEFRGWYADLNKYHIIGFLISSGVPIANIFTLTRNKRKNEVLCELLNKTREVIGKYDLQTITYDSTGDRWKIRKLMLLFNVATLVCKSEKQYRFPFDIFKKEAWDIEHIHATADESDESDDGIWNLALLDSKTNRSYQDKPFDERRGIILERGSKGLFVPLYTKNVFFKVYTNPPDNFNIWADKDKSDYISAIKNTLMTFFEEE